MCGSSSDLYSAEHGQCVVVRAGILLESNDRLLQGVSTFCFSGVVLFFSESAELCHKIPSQCKEKSFVDAGYITIHILQNQLGWLE